MQDDIAKIAREHPMSMEEVFEMYLKGGDHTDVLCKLKCAGASDSIIDLVNDGLWEEERKQWFDRLLEGK